MGEIINIKDKAIEFIEELLNNLHNHECIVSEFKTDIEKLYATHLDGTKHFNGVKILNLKLRYRINKD